MSSVTARRTSTASCKHLWSSYSSHNVYSSLLMVVASGENGTYVANCGANWHAGHHQAYKQVTKRFKPQPRHRHPWHHS